MAYISIVSKTFDCSTVKGFIYNFRGVEKQPIELCYCMNRIDWILLKGHSEEVFLGAPFDFEIVNFQEILMELDDLTNPY